METIIGVANMWRCSLRMLPPNFAFISNAQPFVASPKNKAIASEVIINMVSPVSTRPFYLQVITLQDAFFCVCK